MKQFISNPLDMNVMNATGLMTQLAADDDDLPDRLAV
jgi:hypothetical protein